MVETEYIPEVFNFSFIGEIPTVSLRGEFEFLQKFLTKTPFIALKNGVLVPFTTPIKEQLEIVQGNLEKELYSSNLEFDYTRFSEIINFCALLRRSDVYRNADFNAARKINPTKLPLIIDSNSEDRYISADLKNGSAVIPICYSKEFQVMYLQEVVQSHFKHFLNLDEPYTLKAEHLFRRIQDSTQREINK